MLRKITLTALIILLIAPAFLLAGCQTSSSDQPSMSSGNTPHTSYPNAQAYSNER